MLSKDSLIEIVASDLVFLRDEWDEDVDDHSLRRSSPVLRRLLVDNELQRAWKAAGFANEPVVNGSTLRKLFEIVPLDKTAFAAAGGARYKGMEVRGVIAANMVVSAEQMKDMHAQGVPDEPMGLRQFIGSTSVVVRGVEIPRRVVIKYISNKLGGTHFDPKRGLTTEERLFRMLDGTQHIEVAEKHAVYFELLSAGQALVQSEDVKKLMSTLRI